MIRSAPVDFKQIGDVRYLKKSKRELIDRAKLGRVRSGKKSRPSSDTNFVLAYGRMTGAIR